MAISGLITLMGVNELFRYVLYTFGEKFKEAPRLDFFFSLLLGGSYLACAIGMFKMKTWGFFGMLGLFVLSLITMFLTPGAFTLIGLTLLPLAVAFLMKDFDNME